MLTRSLRPADLVAGSGEGSPARGIGGAASVARLGAVMAGLMLLVGVVPPGYAQDTMAVEGDRYAYVLGQALDAETGKPIATARVTLVGLGRETVTDSLGQFVFSSVPAGEHRLRIRHLRYGSQTTRITVEAGEKMRVELRFDPRAIAVDPLEVSVRSVDPDLLGTGFYRRQASGREGFFAEEEFLEQPVRRRFNMDQAWETMWGIVKRLGMRPRRDCADIFVDGRPKPSWIKIKMDEVAGMEVYGPDEPKPRLERVARSARLKVATRPGNHRCGVILLWTEHRVPGDDDGEHQH